MDLALHGKIAIVTGGSSGLGKASALALAGEGVDVAIVARSPERLQAAAAELAAATGRKIVPVVCDVTSGEGVVAAVRQAVEALGPIDILVNSAAQGSFSRPMPKLAEVTPEELNAQMNDKVMGYLRFAQEVVPGMKERGWGSIINIAGNAAMITGNMLGSIRNISVSAMTRNLAAELGRHGIQVTCVHPAYVSTDGVLRNLQTRADAKGVPREEIEREVAADNALRRLVRPDEIATIVTFLASPKTASLTGESLLPTAARGNTIRY